jgi:hypothetical protein
MYQVSRLGSGFTVLVDGVASGFHETRGEAVRAALEMKES